MIRFIAGGIAAASLVLASGWAAAQSRDATPIQFQPERAAEPGPWHVEASYGLLNPDNFTDIMFRTYRTEMSDEQTFGFGVSRKVIDLGSGFSIEAGVAVNQRIDEGGTEFALPVAFVFDGLPWRDKLPMRLRLGIGPSFTTKVTANERRKDDDNEGSKLLNMFDPEVEVGFPGAPEWAGFVRLHHRSGIFGLINGVTGGSTYVTFGLRHRFEVEGY